MNMKYTIAANWKMNGNNALVNSFADKLTSFMSDVDTNSEIIFCPPFLWLEGLRGQFKTGAQNCTEHETAASTGEISAAMVKSTGCEYVILGHSERRAMGETTELVNEKVAAANSHGLKTILCVGEKEGEDFESIVSAQLNDQAYIIAYEPVWAIGTGKTPSLEEINERHKFIKDKTGLNVMYGGSVKPENSKEISALENVDGLLVGGASLEFESFKQIILNSI